MDALCEETMRDFEFAKARDVLEKILEVTSRLHLSQGPGP
jgi:hypothetical protein